MASIDEDLRTAQDHERAGRHDLAEPILKGIVARAPAHGEAWHRVGLLAYSRGRFAEAEQAFRRTIDLQPPRASLHDHLGNALKSQKRIPEAVASYRRALDIDPTYIHAWHHLGNAFLDAGAGLDAADAYRRGLLLRPDHAPMQTGLGRALRAAGQIEEARVALVRATELDPREVQAWFSLGLVLIRQAKFAEALPNLDRAISLNPKLAFIHSSRGDALAGLERMEDAAAAYERALQLDPRNAQRWSHLGATQFRLGRDAAAEHSFRQALEIERDHAPAVSGVAHLLVRAGKPSEAIIQFERALRLDPDLLDAHTGLANALGQLRRREESLAAWRRAAEIAPNDAHVHYELGNILRVLGKVDEAMRSYRRSADIDPAATPAIGGYIHERQMLCDWDGIEALQADLLDGIENRGWRVSPFVMLSIPSTLAVSKIVSDRWVGRLKRPVRIDSVRRTRGQKLRIGYLSADLREHVVAVLLADLFEAHDRERFEVYAYSYSHDDGSALRKRLERGVDVFRDIEKASHAEAAQAIARDEIDVLIDITGHTGTTRLQIAAARAAPIQVQWIGFAGTMGGDFTDYSLVDHHVARPGDDVHFSEALARMPECYQVNGRSQPIATTFPGRAESGLPADAFVYASFNQSYKLDPRMFAVWMRILGRVPKSVLWIYTGIPRAFEALRGEARKHGIDPDRLVQVTKAPLPEHLGRHANADLYLDTLPYNAHGTASHALWAGLPILTSTGNTYPGRVAGSLLATAGLHELITPDLQAYEDMAVRLAGDPSLMADLRARLNVARTTGPLFDVDRFARHLELACLRMWEIHAAGDKPRSFEVERLPL